LFETRVISKRPYLEVGCFCCFAVYLFLVGYFRCFVVFGYFVVGSLVAAAAVGIVVGFVVGFVETEVVDFEIEADFVDKEAGLADIADVVGNSVAVPADTEVVFDN